MKKAKQILALLTVILIVGFILATFVMAFLDFPNKENIFFTCVLCVIILPIIAWVLMWIISAMTGRKNVASYRTKEMEETMKQADEIRFQQALAENADSAKEKEAE